MGDRPFLGGGGVAGRFRARGTPIPVAITRTAVLPFAEIIIIILAVETGTVPAGVGPGHGTGNAIENHVIEAVYGAFRTGLEQSLVVAGVGMFLAAIIAVRTLVPGAVRRTSNVSFEI